MTDALKQHCAKEERCESAEEAADAAVKKVFAILGVDVNNPASVEEFREDLRFGKRMRKVMDHGVLAIVAVLGAAVCAAVWNGVVESLRRGA